MNFIANWIWDKSGEFERNHWLCFRKSFTTHNIKSATLYISADSRYTVYLNDAIVGRGPGRFWPFAIDFDTYDVSRFLSEGENVLAMEVNHYGTSTSQYIHQPGGLFAQLDIDLLSGEKQTVCSDGTFRCRPCAAFSNKTSRVNVSQPFVEAYDARKIDAGWRLAGFDDIAWQPCVLAQNARERKSCMMPRDIPLLAEYKKHPRAVMRKQWVQAYGTSVTVDFGNAFYPQSTSTADKLQIGYIATSIHSPTERECLFTLVSKMWPFKQERFSVNGIVTVMDIDQRQAKIRLKKGENLFMLDVSGAYQRYYVDLHFDCSDISFGMKEYGCRFLGIGPFDYVEIGNIVCAEGFHINVDDPRFQSAIHARNIDALRIYLDFIHPISEVCIDDANIKTLSSYQRVAEKKPVLSDDQNMVIPNGTFTTVAQSQYDTEFIIDFGTEVSGYVSIDVEAEAGTVIDILGFEYWSDSPEIPDDLNNSMRYIAGHKRSSYTFHRRAGFRYLLLVVRASLFPCKIYEVSVQESTYPAAQTGNFSCSDETLNRIWEISKNSLRLCMEDVFVDCPAFEQAYWIGDANLTALYQYYVFGNADIVKRSLTLAARSLHRSKLPECHVPAGVSFVLSTWALFWVHAASDYYRFTGDAEFERQIYPDVKQTVDEFLRHINADGLLEIDAWNMLDWSGMDTPYHGVVSHLNGFLVQVLRLTAEASRRLGDIKTEERHLIAAQNISQAINLHLWNNDRQAYVDCSRDGEKSIVISLLTQAVLLISGCVPEQRTESVLRLFDEKHEDIVGFGTPFACFFLYEVMASRNQYQELVADIKNRWNVMLEHEATTCWETFAGFYQERLTRSYCHAWSAAPCYMFGRYVLGIVPVAPGFSKVKIIPHTCGLAFAKGSVPTPYGIISVSWKVVNGEIVLEYDVPDTIEVEV